MSTYVIHKWRNTKHPDMTSSYTNDVTRNLQTWRHILQDINTTTRDITGLQNSKWPRHQLHSVISRLFPPETTPYRKCTSPRCSWTSLDWWTDFSRIFPSTRQTSRGPTTPQKHFRRRTTTTTTTTRRSGGHGRPTRLSATKCRSPCIVWCLCWVGYG